MCVLPHKSNHQSTNTNNFTLFTKMDLLSRFVSLMCPLPMKYLPNTNGAGGQLWVRCTEDDWQRRGKQWMICFSGEGQLVRANSDIYFSLWAVLFNLQTFLARSTQLEHVTLLDLHNFSGHCVGHLACA